MVVGGAVIAGGGVHLNVADAVPVGADLVAHAAVGDRAADTAGGVAGEAWRAVTICRALVLVTDAIVANLGECDLTIHCNALQ